MNNLKSWLASEIKKAANPLPELPDSAGQWWRMIWEMHGGTLTEYRDWLAYQSVWVCEYTGYVNPLVDLIFKSIIEAHGEKFYEALRAIGISRAALLERCASINHQAAQRLDDILGAAKPPDATTKRTIFDCLVDVLSTKPESAAAEPKIKPLTPRQEYVVRALLSCGPLGAMTGEQIIEYVYGQFKHNMDLSTFSAVLPALKANGIPIENRKGAGYYIADPRAREYLDKAFPPIPPTKTKT